MEEKIYTIYYTNMNKQQSALQNVSSHYYIIGSIDHNGVFSISDEPAIHFTGDSATKEARRLAEGKPGKAFVVMQLNKAFLVHGMTEY